MIKNLKIAPFFLLVAIASFSLIAMDNPSPGVGGVAYHWPIREDRGPFPVQQIMGNGQDLQPNLGKNQWLLYNKDTDGAVVIGIDLLANCEPFAQNEIQQKMRKEGSELPEMLQKDFSTYQNDQFALSLKRRIEDGRVTSITVDDVAKRTIPCDVSDETLCLFFDMLHWAQLSRKIMDGRLDPMEDDFLISVDNRLHVLSLDQLVKCTNLFNDLGVSATGVGRHRSTCNLKSFLIDRIARKVNGDISSFLQISEDALNDIFNTSTQSLQETKEQYNDLAETFDYKAYTALDNLNKADDKKAIESRITFGVNQKNANQYFDSIITIVEQTNKNIQPTYAETLTENLRTQQIAWQSFLSFEDLRFDDLIPLIEQHVQNMILERGLRDENPAMVWKNVEGHPAIDPNFSEISQEPTHVVSENPQKGMSWKQIVAILGVGSVAAYALYKYLTQKK